MSEQSIPSFLADSEEEDFEDPLSPLPPPIHSAGGGGATKLRKDVLRPGTINFCLAHCFPFFVILRDF